MSALLFVPPVVLILVLGGWWVAIVVGVLVALASGEAFRLLRAAGQPALLPLGIVLALAVAIDAAAVKGVESTIMLLTGVGLVLAAIGSFLRPDPRDGFATWMGTVFGAVYVGMLGFVVRLAGEAPALPTDAPLAVLGGERVFLALLVLGVWSYDSGAYLVGKRFGRTRFLSHISPSKTYAGLVGGVVAATVVVTLLWWGAGQPVLLGIPLGIILALSAQAGDLAESMLKRAARAKDSSTLIPGHGGVLDRIDSFLFAAPIVTLYVLAVGGIRNLA
ncbi:MAG TPA: phosphatidate cytidylyltransferase [Candidatus Limnocylindrales bacterium]|nr:phosphatidate cytidylyltransferase [Candidatus Limnocylindrales bacterium]